MIDCDEKHKAASERLERSEREKRIAAYATDVESGRDIDYEQFAVPVPPVGVAVQFDANGKASYDLPHSWYLAAAQDIADSVSELLEIENRQGFCRLVLTR